MSRSRQNTPVYFAAHAKSGKPYRRCYHSRVRARLRAEIAADDFDSARHAPRPSYIEVDWREHRYYGLVRSYRSTEVPTVDPWMVRVMRKKR